MPSRDGRVSWLRVVGAKQNNLKNLTVEIPLGRFVCVTGVSGSGKSSLVNDIIREALARDLNGAIKVSPGEFDRIEGLEHLDKVIDIDQSPIGRTPRSNPATYIKVFDEIRALFARLPDSKVRGYKPGRFSFNVHSGRAGGGRCEACEGNGANRMEMDFLADVWVTCPVCNGRRFSRETIQILYKGRSIADVLEMDVQEALDHFENVPKIAAMLRTLHDVGLDYLKLGQPSNTLSGGEAQRIKLARELVKRSTGRTLYLLDEPTTGLHFADIKKLLVVLHRFVDEGNTVIVIEHNLDVIKTADWVIDLGPEGGEAGGRIVAVGTPERIVRSNKSYTGMALRGALDGRVTSRNDFDSLRGGRRAADFSPRERADDRGCLPADEASRRLKPAARVGDSRRPKPAAQDKRRNVIQVIGAKQHNLKDISVEVPRSRMTVCCGPSGSGKSSFAVDTVYTEGQRRYVESLSAYARQFLSRLQPPRVDHIYGLSPAICIQQKTASRSPRSTVGTITEIYDYMRVLWARIGQPYCPACKVPVGAQTSEDIVERILQLGEGRRVALLAPVELTGQESYENLFQRERANGYVRVRVDGDVYSLDDSIPIDARRRHRVELVVDRVTVRRAHTPRLTDSVEQALSVGNGVIIAQVLANDVPERSSDHRSNDANRAAGFSPRERSDDRGHVAADETSRRLKPAAQVGRSRRLKPAARVGLSGGVKPVARDEEYRFSQHRSCEKCHRSFEELTPHHFSFNTRMGWCEACEGLGVQQGTSAATIVIHPMRSIADGAIAGWGVLQRESQLYRMVAALARHIGFDLHEPWHELDEGRRLAFLHGCGEDWISIDNREPLRFKWRGFFPAISRATRSSWQYRKRLEDLVTEVPCEACAGGRLRPDVAAVRVAGATLHEVCLWPLDRTLRWFDGLELSARERKIAGELLHEITSRLRFLVDVGVHYLTLHRTASTLSGGESQRIQLAAQIGTGLTGVLYVLDEPTIGLHPRDNARLIRALKKLRDLGNTLLLVEHDREVIDSADHVLDFGPGAGRFGGTLTASAPPRRIRSKRDSLTGRYLVGKKAIPVPRQRRQIDDESRRLVVHGARENNLKEIDVAFPLGRFICVTGVSGSGKSSLVSSILYQALAARIHRARLVPGGHDRITGIDLIDKVINVDQSSIGNSPMSSPATYTGLFDAVRTLYARLPLSKMRGYTANRFSFNRPGGRCEACEGMGQRCIEMHFLPDVWVECENCHGSRYVPETLEVRYRGKNIAEVLSMTVAEALELFENVPAVSKALRTLADVGLDYVQLGQAAPTLSAGEAQRVKLAAELSRPSTGKTLYMLDEPTTGLHFDDLKKLLAVLHRLVNQGNTCICIEHNLDVIKTADWIIDLGPEGGDAGGLIVAEGPPEHVADVEDSFTGAALKPVLAAGPVGDWSPLDPSRDRKGAGKAASGRVRFADRPDDASREVERSAQRTLRPSDLGDDVPMPWERDGRRWHTVDHLDHQGEPVRWDTKLLAWLADTIEALGPFAPIDWNHRTRVEIAIPRAEVWFCHFLTGGGDLLEMAVRVPKGVFALADLRRSLGIKTLDERPDLPVYGQWDRVRRRTLAAGWEEWRLYLRDFTDVHKPRFRSFLKTAARAYAQKVAEQAADPTEARPWTVDGRQWHLSQRSIIKRRSIEWAPADLLALVGRLKSLRQNLQVRWDSKTVVQFFVPDEMRWAARILTNVARGLRVEIRAPRAVLTPTQIDRLGEEPQIKSQSDGDRVVFWVRSLAQNDARQLHDVWRRSRAQSETETVRAV